MSASAIFFSCLFAAVFMFALTAVIESSRGVFDYVRNDWYRVLPNRIAATTFRGISAAIYAGICIVYYFSKSFCLVAFYSAFRFFKFVLWDLWCRLFHFEKQEWYHSLYEIFHPETDFNDYDEEDENDYDAEWFCAVMGDWPDVL